MTPTYLGNTDLMNQPLVAFFCSRRYAPKAVLASYDWATAQHDKVVISTFHSPLERDVMDFLLQKKQPLIYVLPAHMYKRVPLRFKEALNDGRMLLISITSENVRRSSNNISFRANKYILSLASEAVFASIVPASSTEKLYKSCNIDKIKLV